MYIPVNLNILKFPRLRINFSINIISTGTWSNAALHSGIGCAYAHKVLEIRTECYILL